MVRAVYLGVAIQTVFGQHLLGCPAGWNTAAAIGGAWVKGCDMALLAEPGSPGFKHGFVNATVWLVTVAAIFLYGSMLP